jgi:hypothetical protein
MTGTMTPLAPEKRDLADEQQMLSDLLSWLRATEAEIAEIEQRQTLDEDRLRKLRLRKELITRLRQEEGRTLPPEVSASARQISPLVAEDALKPESGDAIDAAVETELQDRGITKREGEDAILAAAEAVLIQVQPLHYRDLAERVGRHVHLGGRDRANTLIAYLSKARDRFERVGRGTYALRVGTVPTLFEREEKLPPKRRRKARRKKIARGMAKLRGSNGR